MAPTELLFALTPEAFGRLQKLSRRSDRQVAEFYHDTPAHDLMHKNWWLLRTNGEFMLVIREKGEIRKYGEIQQIAKLMKIVHTPDAESFIATLRRTGHTWSYSLHSRRQEYDAKRYLITVEMFDEHPEASVMLLCLKHPPKTEEERLQALTELEAFARAREIWTKPVMNGKLARYLQASKNALFEEMVKKEIFSDEQL